jgi:transposase-like protein
LTDTLFSSTLLKYLKNTGTRKTVMDDKKHSLSTGVSTPRDVGRGSRPSLNAAKHGLSATKLLPEVLGATLIEDIRRKFYAEFRPTTASDFHLVDELARHAAALTRAEQIEEGLLRTSARGLGFAAFPAEGSEVHDAMLAAVVGAEALDRLTRHRRAHERAFFATLEHLRAPRGDPSQAAAPLGPDPHVRLHFDEAICREYLCSRWKLGTSHCPFCGDGNGSWLEGREVWLCRGCRRQIGPRSGTVMARSSLRLHVWFAAIYAVRRDPDLPIQALGEAVRIDRRKTAKAIAQRIKRALDSAAAEQLLAGLTCEILEKLALRTC